MKTFNRTILDLNTCKQSLPEEDIRFYGYFGETMPLISVKLCHFKRSYNDKKKLINLVLKCV